MVTETRDRRLVGSSQNSNPSRQEGIKETMPQTQWKGPMTGAVL